MLIACYRETMSLAQELQDMAVEAQACYSLGNTYTLLHNYKTAVEFHLKHYMIAQKLQDRVGEGSINSVLFKLEYLRIFTSGFARSKGVLEFGKCVHGARRPRTSFNIRRGAFGIIERGWYRS